MQTHSFNSFTFSNLTNSFASLAVTGPLSPTVTLGLGNVSLDEEPPYARS